MVHIVRCLQGKILLILRRPKTDLHKEQAHTWVLVTFYDQNSEDDKSASNGYKLQRESFPFTPIILASVCMICCCCCSLPLFCINRFIYYVGFRFFRN